MRRFANRGNSRGWLQQLLANIITAYLRVYAVKCAGTCGFDKLIYAVLFDACLSSAIKWVDVQIQHGGASLKLYTLERRYFLASNRLLQS